jgi:multiple sugar transport system ATP-binding protein
MEKLRIENVWKYYRGAKVEAVKNLNLVCQKGEILILLGPSGCGKTSTLRMIAGLESISKGNIYIGGRKVNNLSPQKRNIAMAFEDYALYPPLSVFENIAFPLRAKGLSINEITKKLKKIAKALKIDDVLDKLPVELSGGQQQRISLARALVKEDIELLLMDEPISHLDSSLKNEIRTEIKRLHIELGNTIVYVTHDQLEAMALGDRIAVMNLGVLQQIGSPEGLYDQPANLFVAGFIGEPPMSFIDCLVLRQNGKFFLGNATFKFPLPQNMVQSFQEQEKVIVGIRPGDFLLSESKNSNFVSISGKAYFIEPVGDVTVIYLQTEVGRLLVAALGATAVHENETLTVSFSIDHIHIFDKKTGKAILGKG